MFGEEYEERHGSLNNYDYHKDIVSWEAKHRNKAYTDAVMNELMKCSFFDKKAAKKR